MKWIKITEGRPLMLNSAIFYDTEIGVFCGWLESDPDEDLCCYDIERGEWPEHVTHWMPLPDGPQEQKGLSADEAYCRDKFPGIERSWQTKRGD